MRWIACLMTMTIATTVSAAAAQAEFGWLAKHSRTPAIRTMREFAEQEFVIPKGQLRGTKLRIDRQPFVGPLLDAMDSGLYRRFAIVGCVQSGKTLVAFNLPVLYYLFEHREPVGVAIPTQELGRDKWINELLPTIQASRYRDLLPDSGFGSKGGWAEELHLRNGTHLRFLSGSGSDAKRSGQTFRVIAGTEVDKMDTAAASSREADPISQIEARTESYADEARIHLECTVSVKDGRIWREYQAGTASRLGCPCPHCGEYVTLEREHLVGWQQATTAREAARIAYFACPACGHALTADERAAMNRKALLVHRGQTIDRDGVIAGEPPDTDTLGFRWNAFNNLFWKAGHIARKEWETLNQPSAEGESGEKYLRQFYHSIPWEPPQWDDAPLDARDVRSRFAGPEYTRGVVPSDTEFLSVGCDLGKRVGHWAAIAWRPQCVGHVIDYGTFDIPSDSLGVERAMLGALRDMRDQVWLQGWRLAGDESAVMVPSRVFVDAGYQPDTVKTFCRDSESWKRFLPTLGIGISQQSRQLKRQYTAPTKLSKTTKFVGEHYHIVWEAKAAVFRADVSADDWKTWLWQRLRTPPPEPGSLVLFNSSDRNEHISYAKQLTAEHPDPEFVPGRGMVFRWKHLSRSNHFLDATYLACASGHLAGVRLIQCPAAPRSAPRTPPPGQGLTMPDGRPWMPNLER